MVQMFDIAILMPSVMPLANRVGNAATPRRRDWATPGQRNQRVG